MHLKLRQAVCEANKLLDTYKLVICSWGNVSAIDRAAGVVAIKPSGVAYSDLTPESIVLLDLGGNVIAGDLNPSSDTPTHLELYRNLKSVSAVCHTHSPKATMWAQACCEIPCFGTTHADFAYGPVPITDPLTEEETANDYELNTGRVIVRRFRNLDCAHFPAVLVANHGPFTWADSAEHAVENALILEQIADMALGTLLVSPNQPPIPQHLLDKHFLRKHGKNAYYGQR